LTDGKGATKEATPGSALTQQKLSRISGVSQDTISDLERGEREAQPRTIRKLAKALKVEPEELMREER
jgi:transcriptional regulator with XRE-family HTH domain